MGFLRHSRHILDLTQNDLSGRTIVGTCRTQPIAAVIVLTILCGAFVDTAPFFPVFRLLKSYAVLARTHRFLQIGHLL
jgi:hypothetical protein